LIKAFYLSRINTRSLIDYLSTIENRDLYILDLSTGRFLYTSDTLSTLSHARTETTHTRDN